MIARLVEIVGGREGLSYPLQGSRCSIGRDLGCAVQIKDPRISKSHAEIRFANDLWTIKDLGSKNGTQLNGNPVSEATLTHGDRIQLGDTELTFQTVREGENWTPSISIDDSDASADVTMMNMRKL